MVVSVCGQRGQHVVRRVELVPSQEAEHVPAHPLLIMDSTAQGTTHRQRPVNSLPVLVREHIQKQLASSSELKNFFGSKFQNIVSFQKPKILTRDFSKNTLNKKT